LSFWIVQNCLASSWIDQSLVDQQLNEFLTSVTMG
jgi:hypothetical protein